MYETPTAARAHRLSEAARHTDAARYAAAFTRLCFRRLKVRRPVSSLRQS